MTPIPSPARNSPKPGVALGELGVHDDVRSDSGAGAGHEATQ